MCKLSVKIYSEARHRQIIHQQAMVAIGMKFDLFRFQLAEEGFVHLFFLAIFAQERWLIPSWVHSVTILSSSHRYPITQNHHDNYRHVWGKHRLTSLPQTWRQRSSRVRWRRSARPKLCARASRRRTSRRSLPWRTTRFPGSESAPWWRCVPAEWRRTSQTSGSASFRWSLTTALTSGESSVRHLTSPFVLKLWSTFDHGHMSTWCTSSYCGKAQTVVSPSPERLIG